MSAATRSKAHYSGIKLGLYATSTRPKQLARLCKHWTQARICVLLQASLVADELHMNVTVNSMITWHSCDTDPAASSLAHTAYVWHVRRLKEYEHNTTS